MKLEPGQKIYIGGHVYTDEIPDDLLPTVKSAPVMVAAKPEKK